MKNSFVMYADWLDMISELDDTGRSELLMAIMLYQNGQDIPDMGVGARVAFAQIKGQFIKDKEKYNATLEKRRKAGKASASAKKQHMPTHVNTCQHMNPDNVNVNDNDLKEHTLTSMQEKQQQAFDAFWKLYPKKKSKNQAMKAWKKINPSSETIRAIMDKLPKLINSADWRKDGGQYIPYPATWLNAGGWEDEVDDPPAAEPTANKFNNFKNNSFGDIDDLERKLVRGGS